MRLLPGVILSLFLATFTCGQTGNDQGVPSRSSRRDFFPPFDRLSPTRRPILTRPGVLLVSQPISTRPPLRFTPPPTPKPTTESKASNDEYYYDYYEYYDDEPSNAKESDSVSNNQDEHKENEGEASRNSLPVIPPFSPTEFRFTTPRSQQEFITERRTTQFRHFPETTTKVPFRFRFSTPERRERLTTLPPRRNTEGSSLLASLIARLRGQTDSGPNPASNDLESDREGRVLDKFRRPSDPQEDSRDRKIQADIFNPSENTFEVASVHSSQSIRVNGESQASTVTKPFINSTQAFAPTERTFSRQDGKRVLSDDSPLKNLPFDEDHKSFEPETTTIIYTLENKYFASNNLRGESTSPPHEVLEEPIDNISFDESFVTSSPAPRNEETPKDSHHNLPPGIVVETINVSDLLTTRFNPNIDTPSSSAGNASLSVYENDGLLGSISSSQIEGAGKSQNEGLIIKYVDVSGYNQEILSSNDSVLQVYTANDSQVKDVDDKKIKPITIDFNSSQKDTSKIQPSTTGEALIDTVFREPPDSDKETTKVSGLEINLDDISAYLPKGLFNFNVEKEKSTSLEELKIVQDDVSKLLPSGFKPTKGTALEGIEIKQDDVSVFLPPGFKPTKETSAGGIHIQQDDVSKFLPPGFKPTKETSAGGIQIQRDDISKFLPTGFKPTKETSAGGIHIQQDDVSKFLPPGFKPTKETTAEGIQIQQDDVSKFLPLGFKPTKETTAEGIQIQQDDVFKFLPPGFKQTKETTVGGIQIEHDDLSKFLPPGFKQTKETTAGGIQIQQDDVSKFVPHGFKPTKESPSLGGASIKQDDISKFLPSGFKIEEAANDEKEDDDPPKKGFRGVILPKRPPGSPTLAPKVRHSFTMPSPLKPKIFNIFDRINTAPSTEYSAPIRKNRPGGKGSPETTTIPTTTTSTTTTTTTTTPPRPTTPGVCGSNCRLGASLRIVSGVEWQPELSNRDTLEFQYLQNEIYSELDSFYRKSSLSSWYDDIEIDSFIPGSVIVSYILFLTEISDDIDTTDLKHKMNMDLQREAQKIGNFTFDPEGTDFVVMPEHMVAVEIDKGSFLIPEWLIAVIVIGLASFLFIVIFGIVALVSRARVRKRTGGHPALTEEILNNLNANGIDNYAMSGYFDMQNAMWNEKYAEKPTKPPSSRGKGYNPEYNVNIYDSWRTDCSEPPCSSSGNQSKRRPELDFDGRQFYQDDPYNF